MSEDAPSWAHFLFVYSDWPVVGLAGVHEKKMRSFYVCETVSAIEVRRKRKER